LDNHRLLHGREPMEDDSVRIIFSRFGYWMWIRLPCIRKFNSSTLLRLNFVSSLFVFINGLACHHLHRVIAESSGLPTVRWELSTDSGECHYGSEVVSKSLANSRNQWKLELDWILGSDEWIPFACLHAQEPNATRSH
jgi:hypothetical protein